MARRATARWVAGLAAVLLAACAAQAQDLAPARESAVKAAFLYKFGSFVEWPAGTFRPGEPLVIGVYGDETIAAELEQLTGGRKVDDRPVAVRRVRDKEAAATAHVLFAGGSESRARELIENVRGPVLTVADGPLGGLPGPVLYFTRENGRVRFAASLAAASARGLRLSAKLLTVAQRVEGR